MTFRMSSPLVRLACLPPLVVALFEVSPDAQDRLKSMPGYDRVQQVSRDIPGAMTPGSLAVTWSDDGRTFEYTRAGKRYRYDVAGRAAAEIGPADEPGTGRGRGGRGGQAGPERGRQFESADSPDGRHKAFYRDRNVWISEADGANPIAVTTDGSVANRIKYGTASWVYGEELAQRTAMWWSPDGGKLAFYRFDESQVPDYHLQVDQTALVSRDDVEAYPKAGAPNPVVELLVYDVASKQTTPVDIRSGKPFDNEVIGHYVYGISWTRDGRELLFHRTNRRQNVLELAAANPSTGAIRIVVHEAWPTGWVENSPSMTFLADGRRFLWQSERNGWNNIYLYGLDGRLLAPITSHDRFEVGGLVKVDEQAGVIFYTARDGDNYMKLQLHRVGLDGTGDVRLTDPRFHHTIAGCLPGAPGGFGGRGGAAGGGCGISPDNRYFVDVYQTHDTPPATRLADATGKTVADLADSDLAGYDARHFRKAELFTYLAADGKTTLHGLLQFPSNFDPSKKYPMLVPVYGGPASASNTARETFVAPNPLTEYGFLVANLDSRSTPGQGKRLLDEIYLKLGQVEIDDMAAGVRALGERAYVDRTRVGIYGTSYGGYASVMSILRHPSVYAAASSSSPVTDWRNYDSIYTERYMWIPSENEDNYRRGSAMAYANDLRGRLLLYYGTADNNVHPSNMMQLIKALQEAGRSFDVQVGPDRGHSGVNQDRMMEFFIEHLILRPGTAPSSY